LEFFRHDPNDFLSRLVTLEETRLYHYDPETKQKITMGLLFLHDNAPAHRALATQKKLAYLDFQCLDHPPYYPTMAPSDYHLFPGLKKQLFARRGGHFCR
jgi:hypothetical protein